MAIEKMTMVNMVGRIEDMDRVCKSVVLSRALHPVNALQQIDTTDFMLSATEDNLEALIDVCYIRPYARERDYSDITKIIKKLKQISIHSGRYSIKDEELIMDYESLQQNLNLVNSKFTEMYEKLVVKRKDKEKLNGYLNNLEYLKQISIPLEDMEGLNNFYFEMYKVSKENILMLKENYENIPSIVMSVLRENDYEIVAVFTPNVLKNETDRIFKTLNCERTELPNSYCGTPKEICRLIEDEVHKIDEEIKVLNENLKQISEENERVIDVLDRSIELEIKASEIKNNSACTKDFFYLSGWVPESLLQDFRNNMDSFGDRLIVIEKNTDEIKNENITPPTKLKNNNLVRPFESMVGMYGIPSYNEMDPTTFLGLSYMVMFGAMFGDLGQGLVFFIAGLLLKYKKSRPNLGGVLARIGVSSSIFGIIYGSFFGFEDVIPALVIRPMENIQDILLYAVVFGCGLLIIGFVYSLINNFKRKDLENGLFSKDGAAGLIFYVLLLIFAYTKLKGINTMPGAVWTCIFVILLTVILLKEPIANLITNNRPLFKDDKKDYFVEGSFGIAETLLSMFSNTVSFIRVGAFALNHVGLFVAFAALAKMMKTGVGSAVMYILGNLIIIGLEGLIVFIQGLRLEYYELFSKYYDGSGIVFEPVRLTQDGRLNVEKKVLRKMDKNMVLEK